MHKLLFDQNLSYRIIKEIETCFPDSNHIRLLNLEQIDDQQMWHYAKDNNFHIVTQDADFADLSIVHGYPPKIIWIRTGNTKTDTIIHMIKKKREIIENFLNNDETSLLELS